MFVCVFWTWKSLIDLLHTPIVNNLLEKMAFVYHILYSLFNEWCVLVTQLCLTLCDPMDYSPPDPLSLGFSQQEY